MPFIIYCTESPLHCVPKHRMSRDVPANADFLCDKARMLGDEIKGTPVLC